MKNFSLTLLLLLMAMSISFAQDNKLDGKGLRKGEWYIMYSGKITYHDPYRLLEDLKKMLVSDKETEKLENANYFEVVKYKKGIKTGEFIIYSTSKNNQGKYPLLAMGEYEGGKISGNLHYDNNNTICTVKYLQGSIMDQNAVISSHSIKHPGTDNITYNFNQQAIFKGGNLTEFHSLNSGKNTKFLPLKYTKTDNGWQAYIYTEKPYCFNNFSFLSKKEIKNNNWMSLIDLNTNNLGFEVYNIDQKGIINGTYKLFQPGKLLFDTTHLSATVIFNNGLRNGTAYYWDVNRDGHSNSPFIKSEYKNDKLHGESILYYSSLGKPAAKMNFENGMLKGKLISWWDADSHHPFIGNDAVANYSRTGGFLMPYQVGKFKDDVYSSIKEFKNQGHDMLIPKGYFRFSIQEYGVDSIYSDSYGAFNKFSKNLKNYSYYVSENTEYIRWFIDENGQVKDFAIKDQNGKNIITGSEVAEKTNDLIREEEKKKQQLLNTIVKCTHCNNTVKIKDSKITWGGCDCFQENGEKIGVYGTVSTYFCSQKCRIEDEKECCRRNGYRFE